MTGFSDTIEADLLNTVFLGIAYPRSPATRLSLHSADPGDTGTNELVNVVDTRYARQSVTWGAPAIVSGYTQVALVTPALFVFLPTAQITHFGIWTPAGDYVGSGTLPVTAVTHGDGFRVEAGTVFRLE